MVMDIQPITSGSPVEAVYAALAEIAAAQALESAVQRLDSIGSLTAGLAATPSAIGAGSAVEHGPVTASSETDVVHPDARVDHGPESALMQAFGRPVQAPQPSSRPADSAAVAVADVAASGFVLPADQLVNAAVIGLTIEPTVGWPTQRRAEPPAVPSPRVDSARDERRAPPPAPADDDEPAARPETAPEEAISAAPRRGVAPDADPDDDWSEPLSRALREAMRGPAAPRALQAALEQWQLGRCVILACPRGSEPSGAAWAFVLWPRPGSRKGLPLALFGVRLDARVQWSRLPPPVDWCHARVMKEQHPRQGRQLIALDAKGTAAVACEVQLGPVPLRTPRWRDACVRIDAVRRLWIALGDQWSVTVVVAARPIPPLPREAA